jgi:uncharacterized membrane protein
VADRGPRRLTGMLRHRRLDPPACLLLGGLGMLAAVWGGAVPPLRFALVVGVLLLLPGGAALSGPLARVDVGTGERVLLALGLSVTLDVLAMLTLNVLPGGVRGTSLVALVTVVSAGLAALRPKSTVDPVAVPAARRPAVRELAVLAAAGSVAAAAIAGSAIDAARSEPHLTTLSIVSAGPPDSARARLEIQNHEGHEETYRLEVLRGGVRLASWSAIRLSAGGTWTATAPVPAEPAASQPVEALLYRAGAFAPPYRRTLLWLPGTGP